MKNVYLSILRALAMCAVLSNLLPGSASAQVDTSLISGTVTDSSGASLAGARVTITNADSGVKRVLVVDSSGHYNSPPLKPAHYVVSAEISGFQTRAQSLVLEVGRTSAVNLELAVASANQSVTVTSEAPLVATESSAVGVVRNSAEIETIPINDNFYCNGALSAEGHIWTDSGMTTDYTERSTGGFGRSYPFDGSDPLAFASSGFIWDEVLRKGLTFRDFGEFVNYPTRVISSKGSPAAWRRDMYLDAMTGSHTATVVAETHLAPLRPFLSPNYAGFDLSIPDVARSKALLKEMAGFDASGDLPSFTLILFGQDHTIGMRPGFPTPNAMMADNDLALGQIVEAISKSQFWKDRAIFVIEDDPQSGLDHVDGRRTVRLVISPYTRRSTVDSTFYNQNSMLRTMELILGLPL